MLEKEIARLPPGQRLVFVMRHHQGLKLGEIATALGLAEGHGEAPAACRRAPAAARAERGRTSRLEDAHERLRSPVPAAIQESGTIELYFYDELDHRARRDRAHTCDAAASAPRRLEDLRTIRARWPRVPTSRRRPAATGRRSWGGSMPRVRDIRPASRTADPPGTAVTPSARRPARSYAGLVAMAALLAIVTIGVVFVARQRSTIAEPGEIRGRRGRHQLPTDAASGRPAGCVPPAPGTSSGRSSSSWAGRS